MYLTCQTIQPFFSSFCQAYCWLLFFRITCIHTARLHTHSYFILEREREKKRSMYTDTESSITVWHVYDIYIHECHSVPSSLYQRCCGKGQHVWQKPTFSCSLLKKPKPTDLTKTFFLVHQEFLQRLLDCQEDEVTPIKFPPHCMINWLDLTNIFLAHQEYLLRYFNC